MPKDLLKQKKPQFGFTLIELLIVIAIIAILIAIGAVSYTTAQRRARDAQRLSDVQKIATALEEFFADNHEYPTTATWENCLSNAGGCALASGIAPVANTYLRNVPRDPQNSSTLYGYAGVPVGTSNQKYTITLPVYEGGTAPTGYNPYNSPTH